jgi:hypothetical protein
MAHRDTRLFVEWHPRRSPRRGTFKIARLANIVPAGAGDVEIAPERIEGSLPAAPSAPEALRELVLTRGSSSRGVARACLDIARPLPP